MKANSILKIAIVAMAAFGAYAFSGDMNSQSFLYIHKDGKCENIPRVCDLTGEITCNIKTLNNDVFPVWMDTECKVEAKHSSADPIQI